MYSILLPNEWVTKMKYSVDKNAFVIYVTIAFRIS